MRPAAPHPGPPRAAPRHNPPAAGARADRRLDGEPFAINSVVPSLPAIEHAFGADYGHVQLILSLFLASVALAQIVIGPLSDRFGRRPVLLGGFALFVVSSMAAPFAPSIDALIAIRIVQGASGCVGIVLGRAIVRDLFDRRQAASMLGYVTMGLAMAPMVAPSIGGIFQEFLRLDGDFWFMAVFGLACLAITLAFVPETNLRPTTELSPHSLFSDYRSLLRMPDFLLFAASGSLSSGVFFAFLGGAPYVAERVLGLAPSIYGLWFGIIAVGYASGSFLAGRFTERFGIAFMILVGSAIAVVSAALPAGSSWPASPARSRSSCPWRSPASPTAFSAERRVGRGQRAPRDRRRGVGPVGRRADRDGRDTSAIAGAALAGGTSAMPDVRADDRRRRWRCCRRSASGAGQALNGGGPQPRSISPSTTCSRPRAPR